MSERTKEWTTKGNLHQSTQSPRTWISKQGSCIQEGMQKTPAGCREKAEAFLFQFMGIYQRTGTGVLRVCPSVWGCLHVAPQALRPHVGLLQLGELAVSPWPPCCHLYRITVHMGPVEEKAVRIIFSIVSKLTLTKQPRSSEWDLHRTAKTTLTHNTSTNKWENSGAGDIFTISHIIFVSATS